MSRLGVARTVGGKLVGGIVVLFGASVLTFFLMSLLPGGPAEAILGTGATPAAIHALNQQLGLNLPLPERYARWIGHALTGDLGRSYTSHYPVATEIGQRLPVTLELIVLSQILALIVAIPAGIWTAYRRNRPVDHLVTFTSFGMIAVPQFVLALVLILVFAVTFHLLPPTGYTSFSVSPIQNLRYMTLPALSLAAGSAAVYQRLLRAEMIETLNEEFISVARAGGLPLRRILLHHAFRPSALQLVTAIGLTLGGLISGAVVVEQIFGLPGLGTLLVSAIFQRDYVVVQGVVLVIAVGFVLANLLVDCTYVLLDPRLRRG